MSNKDDERLRKTAIAFLKEFADKGYENAVECIDWLEKQGEPMEINPTEFDTRLQTLIGKFDSLPKEELIGSLDFWLNVVQNNGTYKPAKKRGDNVNGECNDTALEKQLKIWFEKGKCSGIDSVVFHPEKYGLEKQSENTLIKEIKRRKELLLCEKEKAISFLENALRR